MFSWLSEYQPQPILIDFSFSRIYWYGFLMVLSISLSLGLVLSLSPKEEHPHWWNLAFWAIIFSLLGARLYHALFYNPSYFWENPLAIFKLWQGGLAIHGAIFAGILVVYLYTKKYHLKFWYFSDLIAVVMPLAQAIGRWGNYFNQELFGSPCNSSWCIAISPANRPLEYINQTNFHPAFLYESILDLILFAVLLIIFKKLKPKLGLLTIIYLVGYSIIRFITEFWRLDSGNFGALTLVQWLSVMVIIVSCWFYGFFRRKSKI